METRTFKSADASRVYPKLKLKPENVKPWDETRTAVTYVQPAFADIWYAMMCDRDGQLAWFTDVIPTAGTDDKLLFINQDWFFKMTLDERIFVSCHEIMHAVFNHMGIFNAYEKAGEIPYPDGKRLKFNQNLMNCAADYVINDILVSSKVGKMPEQGLHWPEKIKGDMSVIDAYRILYKEATCPPPPKPPGNRPPPPGGQGGQGKPGKQPGQPGSNSAELDEKNIPKRNTKGGAGDQFDEHMKPGQGRGKTPTEAAGERNPQQWDNAVTAAMQSAKLRGNLPLGLERIFKNVLEVQMDWPDLYGMRVTRVLGNDGYSWEFLDQQLVAPSPGRPQGVGAPGRVKYGCQLVVIGCDSSGSIDQPMLDKFLGVSRNIFSTIRPREVIFCQCDARIHEWTVIDDVDDLDGKVKGGGGTDFNPVFERIKEEGLEPDVLIYLTDLYGPYPEKAPTYPVIWACITDEKAKWGETIRIPVYKD